MTFDEAKTTVVPFGKFAGQAIDQIAETDAGLLWLDWLRGQPVRKSSLREALVVYLDDRGIAADLARLVGRRP